MSGRDCGNAKDLDEIGAFEGKSWDVALTDDKRRILSVPGTLAQCFRLPQNAALPFSHLLHHNHGK